MGCAFDGSSIENISFDAMRLRQDAFAQAFGTQAMIESDNLIAACQQRLDQVAADESGSASDQHPHAFSLLNKELRTNRAAACRAARYAIDQPWRGERRRSAPNESRARVQANPGQVFPM